jgi:hypothetical protein
LSRRRLGIQTLKDRARRMACSGHPADAIARAFDITVADVVEYLDRAIRARLAGKVRARVARGEPAEAIAEALALPVDRVRDYIDRLAPRRGPSRARPRSRADQDRGPRVHEKRPVEPERSVPRQGQALSRPRSRREQAALSDWEWSDRPGDGDGDGPPATIAAAGGPELPRVGPPGPAIAPAMLEDWGPMQASFASGGDQGNAALTDADAVAIRRRRADGVPRKDLAVEFNVSVATITRITRRDTYRDAELSGPPAEAPPVPATVPDPGPQGERWESSGKKGVNAKLTYEDAEEVRRLSREGWTRPALAALKGVSVATIGHILAGRTYADPPVIAADPPVIAGPPAVEPAGRRRLRRREQGERWDD